MSRIRARLATLRLSLHSSRIHWWNVTIIISVIIIDYSKRWKKKQKNEKGMQRRIKRVRFRIVTKIENSILLEY